MKRRLQAMIIAYATSAGAIWGIVEAYTYFEGDRLKLWLGDYWPWLFLGLPVLIALAVGLRTNKREPPKQPVALDGAGQPLAIPVPGTPQPQVPNPIQPSLIARLSSSMTERISKAMETSEIVR